MTESPLRLREIAALSWTAARIDPGHTGESIETLQRARDITKKWLVEVESEMVSRVELRGGSSEGSKDVREGSDGAKSRCCLLVLWKAYKAASTTAGDGKDFKLLCHMYAGFSARVAEAESEIERLSRLEEAEIGAGGSSSATRKSDSPTTSTDSSRRSRKRRSGRASTHAASPRGEASYGSSECVGAAQRVESTSSGSRREAKPRSGRSSAEVGHVSSKSISSGERVETGATKTAEINHTTAESTGSSAIGKETSTTASRSHRRSRKEVTTSSRKTRKTEEVISKAPRVAGSMGPTEKVPQWLETLPGSEDSGYIV